MRKLTSRRAIKKLHMPHKVLLKAFEGKEAECIEAVEETVENGTTEQTANVEATEETVNEKTQSKKARKKQDKEPVAE